MRAALLCAGLWGALLVSGVGSSVAAPVDRATAATALKIGDAAFKAKDYDSAIAAYGRAIELEPKLARAYTLRGFALIEKGEFGLAVADHDQAMILEPRSANARSNSCWARALANVQLDRALADCDLAVEAAPSYHNLDTRGFVHFRRGEFALAITDYGAAIRQYPRLASSFYLRGVSRLRLGQADAAARDIARAKEIEPTISDDYARRGVTP